MNKKSMARIYVGSLKALQEVKYLISWEDIAEVDKYIAAERLSYMLGCEYSKALENVEKYLREKSYKENYASDSIEEILEKHGRIQALKAYRLRTECSLKEAIHEINRIDRKQ